MTKHEKRVVRAKWIDVSYGSEWKYVEDGTDKILGCVKRGYYSTEYHAYIRGEPYGSSLGDFTSERGAKNAVEKSIAALSRVTQRKPKAARRTRRRSV